MPATKEHFTITKDLWVQFFYKTADIPHMVTITSRKDCTHRGFTLVEIVISVIILGILSAVAIVGYNQFINAARSETSIASVTQIEHKTLAIIAASGNSVAAPLSLDPAYPNPCPNPDAVRGPVVSGVANTYLDTALCQDNITDVTFSPVFGSPPRTDVELGSEQLCWVFSSTSTSGVITSGACLSDVPVPPLAPVAVAGNTSATITVAPGFGGGPPTSYAVTASSGSSTCVITVPASSCVLTNLTNGTAYTFTATASNAGGTSGPSDPSNPIIPANVPNQPTGVTGVSGNAQVSVSWSAPTSDGGSGITSYDVTASSGGHTCTTTGDLTCVVTGLTNGTAYTFTVTATNPVGTSNPSDPSNSATPVRPPGWLSVTLSGSSFINDVQIFSGSLYATETVASSRVNKVALPNLPTSLSGATTVAPTSVWSTGVPSKTSGIGFDSSGTVFAASKQTSRLSKFSAFSASSGTVIAGNGAGVPASPAAWTTYYTSTVVMPSSTPTSINIGQTSAPQVVGNYVYFSSIQSGCIYKLKADGSWINTVWCSRTTGAWTGGGGYEARNYHMSQDALGNLYVVNYGSSASGYPTKVVKITPSGSSAVDTLAAVVLTGSSNATGITTNSDASKIWITTDDIGGNLLKTINSPTWGTIASPTNIVPASILVPGANSLQGLVYDSSNDALYISNNNSTLLVDFL